MALTSPTVLLVDDERRYGSALKRALLDNGSIGSIVVRNLEDAYNILQEKRHHLDALVTDLYFEVGDYPAKDLFDGLDLIEAAAELRPGMDAYALSAHADAIGFKQKVMARKIPVREIFDKRTFDVHQRDADASRQKAPWNTLRLDVYRRKIAESPELLEELQQRFGPAAQDEQDLLARLLYQVRPPTITYIEDLGPEFTVRQPIEVLCSPVNGDGVTAVALKLGLLVDGHGDTPSEAVDNLKEVIAASAPDILSATDLDGYAAAVREQLNQYLTVANNAA